MMCLAPKDLNTVSAQGSMSLSVSPHVEFPAE